MNRLDDTHPDAYRLSLLAQVVAERFGDVRPWREMNAQPLPIPRPVIRVADKKRTTAARRRMLMYSLADPIDVPRRRWAA